MPVSPGGPTVASEPRWAVGITGPATHPATMPRNDQTSADDRFQRSHSRCALAPWDVIDLICMHALELPSAVSLSGAGFYLFDRCEYAMNKDHLVLKTTLRPCEYLWW